MQPVGTSVTLGPLWLPRYGEGNYGKSHSVQEGEKLRIRTGLSHSSVMNVSSFLFLPLVSQPLSRRIKVKKCRAIVHPLMQTLQISVAFITGVGLSQPGTSLTEVKTLRNRTDYQPKTSLLPQSLHSKRRKFQQHYPTEIWEWLRFQCLTGISINW